MTKLLTVSIVIPVYNEAPILERCLRAIETQTMAPLEVVVVDNNSTDNSAAIARSFKGVRVITEKRQGMVYARTKGFDAARGDVLGRIDADTQISPNWVERVAADCQADPDIDGLAGLNGVTELSPPGRQWFVWIQRLF